MNAAFALILTMLAAGHLAARLRSLPEGAADVLNRFVITVSLPALVLTHAPKLHWDPGLSMLVVVPWLGLGAGALAVTLAARAFSWSAEVRAALLLCVPLGNTSFLGFPMVAALRGQDAVRYALVYDQLGSFLILSTYGMFVIARYGGQSRPTPRSVLTRMATFPPFLALLVGLLPVQQPAVVASVVSRVGETLVPLAMFAVGMKLELRPHALSHKAALAFGLTAKMLLLPLLAWLCMRALGQRSEAAEVAVLEAGMPPMITAGALAGAAGLAPGLAAALVGYGVLLALVTVPMIAALIQ